MSRRKSGNCRRGPTVFNRNTRRKNIEEYCDGCLCPYDYSGGVLFAKYILEGVERPRLIPPAPRNRTTTASAPPQPPPKRTPATRIVQAGYAPLSHPVPVARFLPDSF